MSVQAFYDELAPLYHLVYENWEAGVARQGKALAELAKPAEPSQAIRLRAARQRARL